jgi:hypothetical protein
MRTRRKVTGLILTTTMAGAFAAGATAATLTTALAKTHYSSVHVTNLGSATTPLTTPDTYYDM